MEFKKSNKVANRKSESVIDTRNGTESIVSRSESVYMFNCTNKTHCYLKHVKQNIPLNNTYKIKGKCIENLLTIQNGIANELHLNKSHEQMQEQISTSDNTEFNVRESNLNQTNVRAIKINKSHSELRDHQTKSMNHAHVFNHNRRRKPKKTNRIPSKNDCELSEQSSSRGARSRLSAYFQSFIPKYITESSESCIKKKLSLYSTRKVKRNTDPKITDLSRKFSGGRVDSKVALRIKYIKWLHDEKKFFNINSIDSRSTVTQPIDSPVDEYQQGYTSKSKKKRRNQAKRDRLNHKLNSISRRNAVSKVDSSIEINCSELNIQNKIYVTDRIRARMFKSVENTRKIKSKENFKKTKSLYGVNITNNQFSDVEICLDQANQDHLNYNENDIINSINPNMILLSSTENKININFTKCTLDYSYCECDYLKRKCEKCKENEKPVGMTVQEENNDNVYNMSTPYHTETVQVDGDSRVNSQTNIQSSESENRICSHLQDFNRLFIHCEHLNNVNQHTPVCFYNSQQTRYLTNTGNHYEIEMKENEVPQSQNEMNSNYNSKYYSISEDVNNDNTEFNCNYKGIQNTDSVTGTSKEYTQSYPIRYLNSFQEDELNTNGIDFSATDKVRQATYKEESFEGNLLRQKMCYQFQNHSNNISKNNCFLKHVDNNDNIQMNYQSEYNTGNDFRVDTPDLEGDGLFDDSVKQLPDENSNRICYCSDAVYENQNPNSLGIYKSERPYSVKSNSDNDSNNSKRNCYSYTIDEETRSRFQNNEYYTAKNWSSEKMSAVLQFDCKSAQSDNEEINTSDIEQQTGRKRKYEMKDSETDEKLSDRLILSKCKSSDASSYTRNEQSRNEILSVMSKLQEKVNVLQDQISNMNTSCSKFKNIEALLVMLQTDMSHGLQQVENKLTDIKSSNTCTDTKETKHNINPDSQNGLKQVTSDCKTAEQEFITDDALTCETELLEFEKAVNNNVQDIECKEIGLMTEILPSRSILCCKCEKNLSNTEICIFDKGIQCRINESHRKPNETQSSFLAVEESNIVFIEKLVKANKSEGRTYSNTKIKKTIMQRKSLPSTSKENVKRTKLKNCIIL